MWLSKNTFSTRLFSVINMNPLYTVYTMVVVLFATLTIFVTSPFLRHPHNLHQAHWRVHVHFLSTCFIKHAHYENGHRKLHIELHLLSSFLFWVHVGKVAILICYIKVLWLLTNELLCGFGPSFYYKVTFKCSVLNMLCVLTVPFVKVISLLPPFLDGKGHSQSEERSW